MLRRLQNVMGIISGFQTTQESVLTKENCDRQIIQYNKVCSISRIPFTRVDYSKKNSEKCYRFNCLQGDLPSTENAFLHVLIDHQNSIFHELSVNFLKKLITNLLLSMRICYFHRKDLRSLLITFNLKNLRTIFIYLSSLFKKIYF